MTNNTLLRFPCLALLAGVALAQGPVQNSDISFLLGPVSAKSQTVPGSSVQVSSATGIALSWGYGYQVMRKSAASLWVEFIPFTYSNPGHSTASISGNVDNGFNTYVPGVRLMAPIHSRVSVYGVLGGGFGFFNYAVVEGGASPVVKTNTTVHGVFDCGGGVDVRLSRFLSIRGEVRDFVTGAGLSGVAGRHHVLPLFGIVLHH